MKPRCFHCDDNNAKKLNLKITCNVDQPYFCSIQCAAAYGLDVVSSLLHNFQPCEIHGGWFREEDGCEYCLEEHAP